MPTDYRNLDAPPPDLLHVTRETEDARRKDLTVPKWSGVTPEIPAIGSLVVVTMNRIGVSTVVGYFVEHGWFGLRVKPHAPPEWSVKQNGRDAVLHVFGLEVGS